MNDLIEREESKGLIGDVYTNEDEGLIVYCTSNGRVNYWNKVDNWLKQSTRKVSTKSTGMNWGRLDVICSEQRIDPPVCEALNMKGVELILNGTSNHDRNKSVCMNDYRNSW